ncbi:hypothetical protein A4D02_34795 [Niastella koreensis]|uniref:Peptidase S45 penicillin amidase n=2 Tax=Niastella koreensis TaxID=354356 RepID=G8TKJ1_NIAKG|nr:penicillin acylase family protein [Niastella koreensis]AEV98665.1 peptidase S45 penicillin amidase [Niastella koreensis GR20-10]OQP44395.1 hypothetical protein A4D02_34795 [Niastella koreensis]
MKKVVTFTITVTALVLVIYICSRQFGNVPPLGRILNPFTGLIQNEDDENLQKSRVNIGHLGLTESVAVYFDNRKVPHIFAKNTADLYFVQGYITASLRLWQMDFLTYVSAGRLGEIFEGKFFDYDRTQRRIGILEAAKASVKMIEADKETNQIITAYTKGVNAYIAQLGYKNMPVEYKLLNYRPEPWSKLKTALLMKYMANTLSGYEEDYTMTNLMLALGEEKFNTLFPGMGAHITPVVNDSTAVLNRSLIHTPKPQYLDSSFLSTGPIAAASNYDPKLGSNSWVISGKKTRSGNPILCADPHLSLSLPCIWLEMQLTAPGINVYGVSIPGTPAVIIGFNEDIAWGITNGSDDVKDWYKLKMTPDCKKYQYDGQWKDVTYTVEEIKRKGMPTFNDTIYHTLHGPIVCDKNFPTAQPEVFNHALKWALHTPSNEFLTFIQLNKAKNYTDYSNALVHYFCPSQNFTFAGKNNDIAVTHQGKMAVKWPGEGKFILDGTNSSCLPSAYIPQDSLPHLLNPLCGYILSANQQPTGSHYPYYYNGYYSENRANRIGRLLANDNNFTPEQMKIMQLDNTSNFAVDALPVLKSAVNENNWPDSIKKAFVQFSRWKGAYDKNDEQAKLFDLWMKKIRDYTWDEIKKYPFRSKLPDDYILLDLIRQQPDSYLFDKPETPEKEDARDIVTNAFLSAGREYLKLKRKGSVRWGDLNRVAVIHMTNIRFFNRQDLPGAGNPQAINAMSSKTGPSWRMIVELGESPLAFGIYAGGQSGNIGSTYYDDFINDWNQGTYYPLYLFRSKEEAKNKTTSTWMLK